MRKAITAMVTAVAIATSTMALPKPAEARCWGCWVGAGIAAGLIGGAVIAGASNAYAYGSVYGPSYAYLAYSEYAYGYAPAYYGGYYAPPAYYPPPAYYAPPIYHGYYHPHYYAHHYYAHRYYGHRYYR
jgi:hypothetical protein